MSSAPTFHIVDYIVMSLFVVISITIGIYYGIIKKQKTTEEYLLGNRQMMLLPVALSMLVTYKSAISVIGAPGEVYIYNTMIFTLYLSISLANFITAFTVVPLVYPLFLTSAYEYYGRRFNSRAVQLLGTFIGMLQTLLYMGIVLYAPALALEAVAGIPLWISIIVMGIIGTIYTSLGGIKSVVWTDVFQFIILYVGLIAVLIIGTAKVGGISKVISIGYEGKRTIMNTADVDPRVRHTLWSCLIGGTFNWLPNCCNQSTVQRISAMKSKKDARMAMLLNIPLGLIYGAILTLVGLVLYAYFTVEECDPVKAGYIDNANQVMPYFVIDVLSNYPGLPGLFIAALFSGSLSSLSSGINAMAANTLEDILGNVLRNAQQTHKTGIAKLIVLVYGGLVIGLAYLVRNLSGPVTQIALSAMGACGGPVAGLLFLGAMFPQANWKGAFFGGLISLGVNIWISVGAVLHGVKSPQSPPVPVTGCGLYANLTELTSYLNYSQPPVSDQYTTVEVITNTSTPAELSREASYGFFLYDLSYLWLGLIGFVLSLVLGFLLSLVTGMNEGDEVNAEYIFPCFRRFWRIKLVDDRPLSYRAYFVDGKAKKHRLDDAPVTAKPTALNSYNGVWFEEVKDEQL